MLHNGNKKEPTKQTTVFKKKNSHSEIQMCIDFLFKNRCLFCWLFLVAIVKHKFLIHLGRQKFFPDTTPSIYILKVYLFISTKTWCFCCCSSVFNPSFLVVVYKFLQLRHDLFRKVLM